MPTIDIVPGPWSSMKEKINSEQLQSFVDTAVTDQSKSISLFTTITPNCLLNTAGIAIGSSKAKIAHGAVNYIINGVPYTLAANAVGVTLAAATTPQNTYGAWALDVGIDGVVDVWPSSTAGTTGEASPNNAIYAIPDPTTNHIRLGVVTCASSAAAGFIAGTTELDAAAVTEIYRNMSALKTGLISPCFMGEDDGTANVAEIFQAFAYMLNGTVYKKAIAAGIALTSGVVTKAAKFGAYRFFIDSAGTVTFQSAPASLVDGAQKQNYSTEAEALAAIDRMPAIGAVCSIATLIITTAASDFTPATTDIGAADVTDTWYDGKFIWEKIMV